MLEIVKDGIIETYDQLTELTKQYGQVVIPNEDEDLDPRRCTSTSSP